MELSTRFIALASVGNSSKKKFIYALNILPVDKMRVTDLIQKTTNEVPCPYDTMNLLVDNKRSTTDSSEQYFYDMNSFAPGEGGRRGKRSGLGHDNRQQKRPRQPNFDQGKYYFRTFQIPFSHY